MTNINENLDVGALPVSIDTLGAIDHGALGREIDKHIRQIMVDIIDRKHNAEGKGEKRKLDIQIAFIPRVELEDGTYELRGIDMEIKAKSTMPPTVSSTVDVRIKRNIACFNQDIPNNYEQGSLFSQENSEESEAVES